MKNVCGACNFQGHTKPLQGRIGVFCLYNNEWHNDSYGCNHWIEYMQMSKSDRLKWALAVKEKAEEKKIIEESRIEGKKNKKDDRRFQIKVLIISCTASFLLGIIGTVSAQWIVQNLIKQADTKSLELTDKQFKKAIKNELERNIRVMQFYVWILPQRWRGDMFLSNSMEQPFLSFFQSKQTALKDVYDIDIVSDILEIYKDSDIASNKIDLINRGGVRTQRDIELDEGFFTSFINKSIGVVKKISVEIGDQDYLTKQYLGTEWSSPAVLEIISKDFIESEKRNVVTADTVTLGYNENTKNDNFFKESKE